MSYERDRRDINAIDAFPLYIIDIYGPTSTRTEAFRARTESHLQKQAFLYLPRHSRDREECLDGYEPRDIMIVTTVIDIYIHI